jgi:lipid-binding SYLF domain-containing protein
MRILRRIGLAAALGLAIPVAAETAAEAPPKDPYAETIAVFRAAGESGRLFDTAYGYAVFPTIGKGGMVVGGAHGKGRVYVGGAQVGNTSVTQLTVGFQLGGQAFSEIVFFQDEAAFRRFSTGTFEFGAQATAVAITAGASAKASTGTGPSAGASGTPQAATTVGSYYNGMAVFTIAKGGLMYEASLGGQKFTYEAL